MAAADPPPSPVAGDEDAKAVMAKLDAPLHQMGFQFQEISAERVRGVLLVTERCCQPFGVLHGGVSAMIAEALGSLGAQVVTGFRRVAGVQLSINHHRAALVGDLVLAEATPLHPGRTIQVWEVHLWRLDSSTSEKGDLLASSKLTVLCNLPVSDNMKGATDNLRKFSKL